MTGRNSLISKHASGRTKSQTFVNSIKIYVFTLIKKVAKNLLELNKN